jgi:putative ubiquitin-RnfH superfamily antitoxin RatB of RatAB toxin-antitoxin module
MVSDIHIEVVYALPERQYLKSLTVPEGTIVEQAILASEILAERNDIDLAVNKVGVFSRAAKLTDVLQEGDRVEIYRPLIADPKELRRLRAEKSKNKTL